MTARSEPELTSGGWLGDAWRAAYQRVHEEPKESARVVQRYIEHVPNNQREGVIMACMPQLSETIDHASSSRGTSFVPIRAISDNVPITPSYLAKDWLKNGFTVKGFKGVFTEFPEA